MAIPLSGYSGTRHFWLVELLAAIADAKSRGVRVAMSIDGTKEPRKNNLSNYFLGRIV
jgi:hypothetical protein